MFPNWNHSRFHPVIDDSLNSCLIVIIFSRIFSRNITLDTCRELSSVFRYYFKDFFENLVVLKNYFRIFLRNTSGKPSRGISSSFFQEFLQKSRWGSLRNLMRDFFKKLPSIFISDLSWHF